MRTAGADDRSGYFLLVDDKPDGRFFLGHTFSEARAALMDWAEVGIVPQPYRVEHVLVTQIEWTSEDA
jgi:hypothetical protein